MKLAFEKQKIKVGGDYHDVFYNNVVIEGKRTEQGNKVPWVNDPRWTIVQEIPYEEQPTYAWLTAHNANIKWEGVDFFAEAPVAFKTSPVPVWLPDRLDENDDPYTFETWQGGSMVLSNNLIGDKFVLKLGALDNAQLTSLDGVATITGMCTKEASALLKGVLYKAP